MCVWNACMYAYQQSPRWSNLNHLKLVMSRVPISPLRPVCSISATIMCWFIFTCWYFHPVRCSTFWLVFTIMFMLHSWHRFFSCLWIRLSTETRADIQDDLRLLLVFDEISGLGSNSLRHLCSALSDFTDVFAVFIDTVSSISLLAPQRKMHPSGRVSIQGLELFHPFSALSSYHAPYDHSRCGIRLEFLAFFFVADFWFCVEAAINLYWP